MPYTDNITSGLSSPTKLLLPCWKHSVGMGWGHRMRGLTVWMFVAMLHHEKPCTNFWPIARRGKRTIPLAQPCHKTTLSYPQTWSHITHYAHHCTVCSLHELITSYGSWCSCFFGSKVWMGRCSCSGSRSRLKSFSHSEIALRSLLYSPTSKPVFLLYLCSDRRNSRSRTSGKL